MNNKERVFEVFTKYGFVNMDYVNDDKNFIDEMNNYAAKLFVTIDFRKDMVAIITGCFSDVREVLHEYWNPANDSDWEEIDFYMEYFEII